MNAAQRAAALEALIPRPPADVVPLRIAFSKMVARQWDRFLPAATAGRPLCATPRQSAKTRFLAEMYARACYSMLLLSAGGPAALRLPMRAASMLPLSRGIAIRLGGASLFGLDRLVPRFVHRQVLLTSALMGALDAVLDDAAASGESAATRIASLTAVPTPPDLLASEEPIAALARLSRAHESPWQAGYRQAVLVLAVRDYCLAEALALAHAPDPKGMCHRWAGIDAATKGMWYAIGPHMGLQGSLSRFEPSAWNREQHWMADTSLLMQMIDDWVDQDEDRGARPTPVAEGSWNAQTVDELYRKTVRDLAAMLEENGIRNRVLQELFLDLYNDYLHVGLRAMGAGVAA